MKREDEGYMRALVDRYRDGNKGPPEYKCKKCSDVGWVYLLPQEEPAICTSQRCTACYDLAGSLSRSGVPADCKEAQFATALPHLQKAAQRLKGALEGKGRGAVIRGPVGTGKTFLMGAATHCAAERGMTVLWKKASHVLEALESVRQGDEGETDAGVMGPLRRVDLLALDDLGAHRITPAVIHRLEDLLDDRVAGYEAPEPDWKTRKSVIRGRALSRKKMLLITTNLNEKEIERKFEGRFASRMKMLESVELPELMPDVRRPGR